MAIGLQIKNGDWVIDNRKVVIVQKQDKVKRDVHKFLTTDSEYEDTLTTFSRYNPKYGVELNKRSLYRGLSIDTMIDQMNKSLSASLKWFLALQESRANLSAEEVIQDMQFYVFQDPDSKTSLKLKVQLLLQGSSTYSTLGVYSQEVA